VGRDGVHQEPRAADCGRGEPAVVGGSAVEAREQNLLSEEHFTVDGTLIQAWARPAASPASPVRPLLALVPGTRRVLLRDRVESKTDPDARLFKKATADKSVPSYQATR